MLNLVRFDREWFVVDVGMGAMGPNIPYPLLDGYETVSIAPRKIRLQFRPIPEHAALRVEDAPKLWCFDVCHSPCENPAEDKWLPTYCFTETEFLPQDYQIMSWFTSSNPKSFFTHHLLGTKMLMDEEGEKIIGDITIFNDTIRKTVVGKRETVAELKTEQDRIDALKTMFDIDFTEEEKVGIAAEVKLG
jgi:arylamine N-acetyltransferase